MLLLLLCLIGLSAPINGTPLKVGIYQSPLLRWLEPFAKGFGKYEILTFNILLSLILYFVSLIALALKKNHIAFLFLFF